MEFETFDCNRCGASLTQVNEDTYKCEYCGKVYHAKAVAESTKSFKEMFDDSRREHINNLRRNLYEATNAMFISSKDVETCADELKHEIPDDFLATFFKIAAGHDDKAICKFIRKIDVKKHYDEIDHILNFLIRSLQPAYMLDVGNLIERAYKNTDLIEYEKHATALSIEQEKVKKGIYEVTLPREAFIAYSSKDMEKVTELVEVLESQGIECFVAARNLRHGKGAVENYNKALEDAMDHCKCFVFVSSLNSRSTGCDAVRIEIPHIQKMDIANAPAGQRNNYALVPHEFKKPRVEYRIEESNGFNVADKITNEFFEGYERVYSPEEVAVRVFKQITAQAEKKVKYCRSCGEEHDLEAKFCSKCANSIFVEDAKLVDHSAPVIAGVGTLNNTAEGVVIESDPSAGLSGGDATIKRGFMHLSFGEFEDADSVFEKALDINSKNAHAYLGKLMVNLRVKNEEELVAYPRPFNDNKYFKYAIRWADSNFQRKLNGFIDRINDRIEGERKDAVLKQACDMMDGEDIAVYQKAIALLESISPWKESKERIDECYKRIEAIELMREHERMDRVYEEACLLMNGYDPKQYRNAISKFCTIPNWKDSKEKIEECNKIIESIEHKNEHDRQDTILRKAIALMALEGLTVRQRLLKHEEALNLLESIKDFENVDLKIEECTAQMQVFRNEINAAREKDAKRRSTRKTKKVIIRSVFAAILAATISFVFIFSSVIMPDTVYAQAVQLMETGDYSKAVNLLYTLDGYKDSDELIKKCTAAIKDADYASAVQLMNDGKYEEAMALFIALDGYKDSAKLLEQCRNVEKDKTYDEAVTLMNNGDYSEALSLFKSLGGYKDAAAQAAICQNALSEIEYQDALALYNEGRYEEAMSAFNALGNYSNSVYMFELCRDEVYSAKYAEAVELMANGEYASAYLIFQELSGFKDADDLMAECYAFASLVFTLNNDGTGYIVSNYSGTLKSVVIPPYYNDLPVVGISSDAFAYNTSLESIVIPEGVTRLESYTFNGCSSLKSVTLPDRLVEICCAAFYECNSLTSITLPFIGFSANDNDYSYLGHIFGANGYYDNENYVPTSLKTVVITGGYIANYAFYGCSNITEVTLPQNITRIGNNAFQYCYKLKTVNIPESVVTIGESAFYDCDAINNVTIPEGVTSIGSNAFYSCDALSSIDIPGGVTAISDYTFYNCSSLKSVSFGDSLDSISTYAFYGCSSLADISLPMMLSSIGSYAFGGCTSITDIVVGEGVKSIGEYIFYDCSSLESITIPFVGSSVASPSYSHFGYLFGASSYYSNDSYVPSSLKTVTVTGGTSIAGYAFYECSYITTLTLPDALTSVGHYALYGCSALKELTLPFAGETRDASQNTYFGYIFGASSYYDNNSYIPSSLKTVNLTNTTRISDYAFYQCYYITDVNVANGLETIGQYALYNCGELKRVNLPRTLKSIGENALSYNYNLATVTFAGSEEEWNVIAASLPANWIYGSGSYTSSGVSSLEFAPTCNGVDHEYLVILEAVAPTCEESGLTEGQYCSLCNVTIVEQEVVEALDHIIVQHEAKGAVYCDDDSWDAYEACEREGCGYTTQVIVSGYEHVYVDHEAKYVDCTYPEGEVGWDAYRTCENCDYTEYKEQHGGHVNVHYDGQEPTCENIGWAAYDICERCGYSTYSEIAKLGHNFNDENSCENCGMTLNLKFTYELDGNGNYYITGYEGESAEVIIPAKYEGIPVVGIDSYVFSNNQYIKNVVIPDSVTYMGYGAFSGCSNIESITLPFIGQYADNSGTHYFAHIFGTSSYYDQNSYVPSSLKSVVVTSEDYVPTNAFYGCAYIESITLNDEVSSIGGYAFYTCNSLKSFTMPDGVTSSGGDAFDGCTSLEAVYVNDISHWMGISFSSSDANPLIFAGILYVGGEMLTELILPDDVTSIGAYAFYGCTSIADISMHENIQEIGTYAFAKCTSLVSVEIPESVTAIGLAAFKECSGLRSITVPFIGSDTNRTNSSLFGYIFGSNSYYDQGAYYVPEFLETVTVTSITAVPGNAFYNCYNIKKIILPDTVTEIGGSAFNGCSGLEEFTLPESVTTINNSAFNGCSSLTSLVLSENVTYIGDSAFYGCSSITEFIVPQSVTEICQSAFYGCSSLESITLPYVGNSVTSYSTYTNFGYIFGTTSSSYQDRDYGYIPQSLKKVTITGVDGFKSISSSAFQYCEDIEEIVILANITSVGTYAFAYCSSLTSLSLPEGVTTVNGSAFISCTSLVSLEIPSTVTSFSGNALSGCEALENLSIPAFAIANISSYGVSIKNLKTIVLTGNGSIGSYAFDGCVNLESITIEEGITSIGSYAFNGCTGIKSIVVPNSVTSIGQYAFNGCYALESISLPFVGASPDATSASASTLLGYVFNEKSDTNTSILSQKYSSESSIKYFIPRKLENITITGGTILYGAFSGCQRLTVTIGNGVTNIDSEAFAGIPQTQQNGFDTSDGIGKYYGDILLSITDTEFDSYEIKEGTRIIASGAFDGCSGLTGVTIPESVTVIGSSAFAGCVALEEITIPETVVSIGEYAFNGCVLLGDITIPSNVKSIGAYAFAGCTGVTNLTIADGVEVIGDYAFVNISNVTAVSVPNSVTLIGKGAFSGWASLAEISLPFIGASASESYSSSNTKAVLGYIFGDVSYTGSYSASQYYYSTSYTTYYIPSSLKKVSISGDNVPYGAFSGCNGITTIKLSENLTSIAGRAFYNATLLSEITIPEGVESVGDYAFYNCSSIKTIKIPDSVTYIGSGALSGCEMLESLTVPFAGSSATSTSSSNHLGVIFGSSSYSSNSGNIPTSLKTIVVTGDYNIRDYAFYGFSNVESITLSGEAISTIGQYAFYGCSKMTSITIPDTVTAIHSYAFYNCAALQSIELPDSLTSIANYAFGGCASLVSVDVPDSVTSIGLAAFYGCSELQSIELPFVGASVNSESASSTTVFGYIFGTTSVSGSTYTKQYFSSSSYSGCYIPSKLKNVTITGGKVLYGAFYNCMNIESITIGDGVSSLGTKAFYGCTGLADIVLGNGIVTIGDDTFSSCSGLKHIKLGNRVTKIGERAFSGCTLLETVSIPESIESIASTAFEGCDSLVYTTSEGVSYLGNDVNPCVVLVKVDDKTLETFTVGSYVRLILEGAFKDCTALYSLTISEGVTAIGDNAFAGCTSLGEVVIPDSVVRIGVNAFNGCGLTDVTIGKGVTYIGADAFSNCESLENVTFVDIEGWKCYYYEGDSDFITINSEDIYTATDACDMLWACADMYWIKNKE